MTPLDSPQYTTAARIDTPRRRSDNPFVIAVPLLFSELYVLCCTVEERPQIGWNKDITKSRSRYEAVGIILRPGWVGRRVGIMLDPIERKVLQPTWQSLGG